MNARLSYKLEGKGVFDIYDQRLENELVIVSMSIFERF